MTLRHSLGGEGSFYWGFLKNLRDKPESCVNIENMKPMTEDHHCPTEAVRYALEMNQGWFTKKGIGAGQTISGLPR